VNNDQEIREAMELVKKSHPYATKYKGVKEDEALQTLIELAQLYLSVDGFPKEKEIPAYKDSLDLVTTALIGQAQGFNQALQLCKLAHIKSMPTVEEVALLLSKELLLV